MGEGAEEVHRLWISAATECQLWVPWRWTAQDRRSSSHVPHAGAGAGGEASGGPPPVVVVVVGVFSAVSFGLSMKMVSVITVVSAIRPFVF